MVQWLRICRPMQGTKKICLKVELFYLVEMFRTPSLGNSLSVALKKKMLRGGRRGSQAINRLYTSLPQRSLNIKDHLSSELSILCMGRFKPLGSLNSLLSYAPQLSGANPVSLFTLLLEFPQLLSKHRGGWQHPMDHSFGSPHSHLEVRNH